MFFKINCEIFEKFPDFKVGVIIAKNLDNSEINQEISDLLENQIDKLNKELKEEDLAVHPNIISWQNAYKKFGAKPKEHLSSTENLAKRALKDQKLNKISNLVDIYNYISLKFLLPVGAEDLDTIDGNIELTFAKDNEKSVLLLGEKEAKSPKNGEVIYKDKTGVICRRWNWKEAERTKITQNSKNAILFVEALNPVDFAILKAATYKLAELIKNYCKATVFFEFLDAEKCEINLDQIKEFKHLDKETEAILAKLDIYNKKDYLEAEIHHAKSDSKEHELRIEKIEKLKKLKIEPWPGPKEVTTNTAKIKDEYKDDNVERQYSIAGRLMSIRLHGKTLFADLQDFFGRIQIYLQKDIVGSENFDFFNQFLDIGDIIWCTGSSFKTKLGEITLKVNHFNLLAKSLHPLPEKFHGLSDIEIKYRQRYLDLMTSAETKDRFVKRSSILRYLRNYLDDHGYIEVETPMLHPIAGGAAAKPFVTHHNALDSNFYLRIAPELYLKRLVVGGIEKVYEINRNFRNEGISTRHNPEFTMLEFYTAHKDYRFAMEFTENLLRYVSQKANGQLALPFGNHTIDFEKPFLRISIKDSVKFHLNLSEDDISKNNIDKILEKNGISIANKQASVAEKIFAIFDEKVQPKLIQPTFIIDFPVEISPLAKRDPINPNIATRFELYIAGMEIANGFNELNDPFDQADRFNQQLEARKAGDEEAHQFDADYVKALEYGLPPSAGVGIGIDRLTMLLTNTTSIKEVILFPTLKKKD